MPSMVQQRGAAEAPSDDEVPISVIPLGAGQEVGRSCILVRFGDDDSASSSSQRGGGAGAATTSAASTTSTRRGRRPVQVLLDCGISVSPKATGTLPEFERLGVPLTSGPLTDAIDLVLISHFHLDHCGALPLFTEVFGYKGPVLMSPPTRVLCPLLVQDHARLERGRGKSLYTEEQVSDCFRKTGTLDLGETYTLATPRGRLEVTAHYAGHCVGAVMFYIRFFPDEGEEDDAEAEKARCSGHTTTTRQKKRRRASSSCGVFYTGDFNPLPERHLAAAQLPRLPESEAIDVVITECTYGTTVRDSRLAQERKVMNKILASLEKGGKVLIPTSAVGRWQELCALCEDCWREQGLAYPLCCSKSMADNGELYRQFRDWGRQPRDSHDSEKTTLTARRPEGSEKPAKQIGNFPHLEAYDHHLLDDPGWQQSPRVVFAAPASLQGGWPSRIHSSAR